MPLTLALENNHEKTVALLFEHAPTVEDSEKRNLLDMFAYRKRMWHFWVY